MLKHVFCVLLLLVLLKSATAQQYNVYALKYATLAAPTPVTTWVNVAPEKDSVPIAFMFWLIKEDGGKTILLDAGCKMDLPNAIDFGLTNFIRPDSLLAQLNVAASEVTDIIISHPHWDHIDGIDLFKNAQVWMQKDDYNYYVSEGWQKENKPGGIAKRSILHLVDLNLSGKLRLIDGDDKEIIPGIKVLTGSRHTYNSQTVLVQSGTDRVVLASDNIWIYYNLEKMLPPPSYGTFNAQGYVSAMERMKKLASKPAFIIPGHDDALFSKFPKVNDRIVKIK